MNATSRPRYGRQGGGPLCDGAGWGRRRRAFAGDTSGGDFGVRGAARTLAAVGAFACDDLRDPNGLARPLLRRAALRLAVSRPTPLRRLGDAYLRRDPADADELSAAQPPVALLPAPGPPDGELGTIGPRAVQGPDPQPPTGL